jgi:hypothetical protein
MGMDGRRVGSAKSGVGSTYITKKKKSLLNSDFFYYIIYQDDS